MTNLTPPNQQNHSAGNRFAACVLNFITINIGFAVGLVIGTKIAQVLSGQENPSVYLLSPIGPLFGGCIAGLMVAGVSCLILRSELSGRVPNWFEVTVIGMLVAQITMHYALFGRLALADFLVLTLSLGCGVFVGLIQCRVLHWKRRVLVAWTLTSGLAWFSISGIILFLVGID